jgi:hypothetical protein
MSTGDKLNALLSRRCSWQTLDWKRRIQVPMSGSCRAYELVSGVFAKSTAAGSVFGSRQFVMARLPSRRNEGAEIVREDVGVASRDFIIDPTQDLIGYISERVESPITLILADRFPGMACSHTVKFKFICARYPQTSHILKRRNRLFTMSVPYHS